MFRIYLFTSKTKHLKEFARFYAKAEPAPAKKGRAVFKVYRYGGILTREEPKIQNYDMDLAMCGNMVLDAMIKIKDMDPTLTFRRSCREGICGSCAINLNGTNCLACITKIPQTKTITILPVPHMYVQRDLVVDMTHFLDQYDSIRPYLIRRQQNIGAHQYAQSIPDSMKLVGLYECILCGCCSTACPSYWWNGRRFLGPCALLHAYRWVVDSRDEDHIERMKELRDDFKVFRCHAIFNCTLVCPKDLNPGEKIHLLKRLVSGLDKKQEPEMDPMAFGGAGGGGGLAGCIK